MIADCHSPGTTWNYVVEEFFLHFEESIALLLTMQGSILSMSKACMAITKLMTGINKSFEVI